MTISGRMLKMYLSRHVQVLYCKKPQIQDAYDGEVHISDCLSSRPCVVNLE